MFIREFGTERYTLLYLKWITNKDPPYSTGSSAQCHVAACMGGEFGGEWIHAYLWLSPFAVHLKQSQDYESAVPQYKIKHFKAKLSNHCYRFNCVPHPKGILSS